MPLRISVPATTANLGPGFDIWGLALDLRNEFICEKVFPNDGKLSVSFHAGASQVVQAADLPKSIQSDNLFIQAFNSLFKKAGVEPHAYKVQILVNVPFSRGLGSSSTAILAGLVLANETLRREYSLAYRSEQLLEFALEFEPHPDNLMASYYGGWQLCLPGTNGYHHAQLDLRAPIKIAGVIPALPLETRDSRQLIPEQVSRSELVFQTSRVALLTNLLSKPEMSERDQSIFRMALEDKMHTQQRAHLIPGMLETFDTWHELGALGCFLSGAGSTLLAFWPRETDTTTLNLGKIFKEKKIDVLEREFRIDFQGLMLLN